MKGDRTAILGRIAEALQTPAPVAHSVTPAKAGAAPFRAWLPPVGEELEEQIAVFARLSAMLKTEFHRCASMPEAAKHLTELAAAGGWRSLALHSGALCDALAEHLPESLSILRLESGYDRNAMEACDAGLTECESLVAQTGSVCVSARSSGGRALSVLPPHHVVIAQCGQVVPDLLAAYADLAAKHGGNYPSFFGFISGPSRTGDIERILVLGAHGPKRLTVLLVP